MCKERPDGTEKQSKKPMLYQGGKSNGNLGR